MQFGITGHEKTYYPHTEHNIPFLCLVCVFVYNDSITNIIEGGDGYESCEKLSRTLIE